jgi:flagellar motor switch protein FliN/FliY
MTITGTQRSDNNDSGLPMDLMYDLPVEITVELGRRRMTIGEFLDLGPGAVLELRKLVGDPLEIRVNQRLVARGEAVAVGEMYGIRITEVLKQRSGGAQAPLSAAVSETR